jgi:hypothetical protein
VRRLIQIAEGWPSGLRRPVKTGFSINPGRGFGDPVRGRRRERSERAHPTSFVVDEKKSVGVKFCEKIDSNCGGMAEWFKAAVLKTASPKGDVGSNPTPSAMHHVGCMAALNST